MAAPSCGRRAWARLQGLPSTTLEISTWAIAVAQYSKLAATKEIFVFATLEPSIVFYHLAFSPAGELYATGPTTSSFDRVYRISQGGDVKTFYRGLGRPQGLAFDRAGNLYVAASLGGHQGIVRVTPEAKAELVLSGNGIVGMALLPTRRAYVATTGALYSLDWDIEGLPLPI